MIDRFEPPYKSFSVSRGSQQCANRLKLENEKFAAELLELVNEMEDDGATSIESAPTEDVRNISNKPDLANADLRHAAQDAITKARDTSKAEIEAPAKLTAEPVNAGTHASIGAETTPRAASSTTATGEETAEHLVADYYFPACTTDDDLSGTCQAPPEQSWLSLSKLKRARVPTRLIVALSFAERLSCAANLMLLF